MSKRKGGRGDAASLRQRAEERLRESVQRQGPTSPADAARIVHELQVHQIELEMQNEELLRSRADLESALESYSELYDFAPVGYLTLDREGTIARLNLTGARLLGVERSLLLGRRLATFIAPADRQAFDATLRKAMARDGSASCEVELTPLEGRSQPLWVEIAASGSGGEQCRAVLVDITARKQTEAQLRAALKMEAIGRLAGGVAHDFNNILTVILSHAQFALDAVGEGTAVHEDLVELKRAAEHAAALTRQLLAFGRKQVLHKRILDVNEHIRGVAKMLGRVLGEDVELVLALADDLGRVELDPAQIEQVIVNLALNARDAMPEGGKLTVRTSNADVDWSGSPTMKPVPSVLVSVSDTGIGMDEATSARIFEPFFSTKEKDRGTGFGLSTVYGIVKQCGGDIRFRTRPGEGTTFELQFPRAASTREAAPPPPASVEAPAHPSETILVVEDEPALLKITQRILASAGYQVLVASSGEEALRICDEHPGTIHLALSDVLMPKMTGLVFAERLARSHPRTKVLLMSGYATEAMGEQGAIDAASFIGKPFTAEELKRKVRAILDSHE